MLTSARFSDAYRSCVSSTAIAKNFRSLTVLGNKQSLHTLREASRILYTFHPSFTPVFLPFFPQLQVACSSFCLPFTHPSKTPAQLPSNPQVRYLLVKQASYFLTHKCVHTQLLPPIYMHKIV